MATETGYNWDTNWTEISSGVALTQGGTITWTIAAPIDLDLKAACIIGFNTTYSNHAKATAGLSVTIKRQTVDTPLYETAQGAAVNFEMPFTQNALESKAIFLSGQQFSKFNITLDWGNTTGSSVATTTMYIKYATIPAAVA